jgi:hypothetical protein
MRKLLHIVSWIVLAGCDGGSSEIDAGPGVDGGLIVRDAGNGFDAGSFAIDAGPPADGGASADGVHPLVYLNDDNRTRLREAMSSGTAPAVRFRDIVDLQIETGDVYGYEPWFSALAYQVTDDASYCTHAVAMTEEHVVAEEALIAAGERAEVAADSYLYVGPTIGSLALVYDFCREFTSDAQRARWIAYANQAVFNVWHPNDAVWGGVSHTWSGWSIDNPANNYYYSFLRATMLLGLATRGEDAMSGEWLRIFREEKIRDQLVPMFSRDLVGGGSREGTGYGTALMNLFELYDLWQASTGENIAALTTHARLSMIHFLHTVVPTGDYLVPVGDHARDSTAALFDYHRMYLLVLAHLFGGTPDAAVARGFLRDGPLPEMQQRFMFVYDYLDDHPELEARPLSDLHPAYYGTGTGQLYFRSSWDPGATLLHAIAGPFTESHAHEDQGSFLLYSDDWLAYDSNVASHSGIVQDTTVHNLVRLDRDGAPMPQYREREPGRVIALHDDAELSWVALEAAPVYDSADVTRIRRDIVFLKPSTIVVLDRVEVADSVRAVWQLNTPLDASISDEAVTLGTQLSVLRVSPSPDEIESGVVDYADDVSSGHRVELRARAPGDATFLNVLSIDGAVVSAIPAGALGTALVLEDGRHATVDLERMWVVVDGVALDLIERVDGLPIFAP